jgi:anti-sigma factor RsiW
MNDDGAITEADLHAYVDGGLAANRRAEVESWLAAHPDQAERVAAYRRLSEELRARYEPVLAEPVPAKLMHAWRREPRWRAAALAAVWVVFGVALGGYAGWQLHALRTAPLALADGIVMARRAAVAHAVYSPEVRHPVEVGADQEQHLVAWLSKRLGVKVKAPNLSDAEMSLVGGRLLPGETGPVAQFMYQTERGRRLTLYVRAETAPHRESAFRYARESNVGVFYWIERECAYAIASADLNKEELLRVATMVYKQLNQ